MAPLPPPRAPPIQAVEKVAPAPAAQELRPHTMGSRRWHDRPGAATAAEGKGPHLEVEPSNSGGPDHDHMVWHNEATEALWRGLVSAGDVQWAHGAELLAGQGPSVDGRIRAEGPPPTP